MSSARPQLLLTGASGFLGRYVAAELEARGIRFATAGRADADFELDLGAPARARRIVADSGAQVVLNVAALSSMTACERAPELALAVNGRAVAELAAGGAARIVQVSTDLVFDGTRAPYDRDRSPAPLGAYARSKVAGEEAALAASGLVVRLPLMFGPSFDGRRGATDMLRSAIAGGRRLGLFTNEFRTPLHAADAARVLVELALGPPVSGVRHVAGAERVSRFELAERFRAAAGLPEGAWRPAECADPLRPRDVSLVSDVEVTSGLDERLAGC